MTRQQAEARFRAFAQQVHDDALRKFESDLLCSGQIDDVDKIDEALAYARQIHADSIDTAIAAYRKLLDEQR